MSNSSVI